MPQDLDSTAPAPSPAPQPPSAPSATAPAASASATVTTSVGGAAPAGSATVSRQAVDDASGAVPSKAPAKETGHSFFSATGFGTSTGSGTAGMGFDSPQRPRMRNAKRLGRKSSGESEPAASPGVADHPAWEQVESLSEDEVEARAKLAEGSQTFASMVAMARRVPHFKPETIDLFEKLVSKASDPVAASAPCADTSPASPQSPADPQSPSSSDCFELPEFVHVLAGTDESAMSKRVSDVDVRDALMELELCRNAFAATDQPAGLAAPASLSADAGLDFFGCTLLNQGPVPADFSAEDWARLLGAAGSLFGSLSEKYGPARLEARVDGTVSVLIRMSHLVVGLAHSLVTLAARLRTNPVAGQLVSRDTDLGRHFLWSFEAAIKMAGEYWSCASALSRSEKNYKLLKTRFDRAYRNLKALEAKEAAWVQEKKFYQAERERLRAELFELRKAQASSVGTPEQVADFFADEAGIKTVDKDALLFAMTACRAGQVEGLENVSFMTMVMPRSKLPSLLLSPDPAPLSPPRSPPSRPTLEPGSERLGLLADTALPREPANQADDVEFEFGGEDEDDDDEVKGAAEGDGAGGEPGSASQPLTVDDDESMEGSLVAGTKRGGDSLEESPDKGKRRHTGPRSAETDSQALALETLSQVPDGDLARVGRVLLDTPATPTLAVDPVSTLWDTPMPLFSPGVKHMAMPVIDRSLTTVKDRYLALRETASYKINLTVMAGLKPFQSFPLFVPAGREQIDLLHSESASGRRQRIDDSRFTFEFKLIQTPLTLADGLQMGFMSRLNWVRDFKDPEAPLFRQEVRGVRVQRDNRKFKPDAMTPLPPTPFYSNYTIMKTDSERTFASYGDDSSLYQEVLDTRPWDEAWRERVTRLYLFDPTTLDASCQLWLARYLLFTCRHRQALWEHHHWLHTRKDVGSRLPGWTVMLVRRGLLAKYLAAATKAIFVLRPRTWPAKYDHLFRCEPAFWHRSPGPCTWAPDGNLRHATPPQSFLEQVSQLDEEEPTRVGFAGMEERFVETLLPDAQVALWYHHYVGVAWDLPGVWHDPDFPAHRGGTASLALGTPGPEFYKPDYPHLKEWERLTSAVSNRANLDPSLGGHYGEEERLLQLLCGAWIPGQDFAPLQPPAIPKPPQAHEPATDRETKSESDSESSGEASPARARSSSGASDDDDDDSDDSSWKPAKKSSKSKKAHSTRTSL